MPNEEADIIEAQNDEQELDLDLTEEAPAEDQPAEKTKETPEAKLARMKRQVAQMEKHMGVKSEVKPEPKSAPSQSSDLGYAEKAFLIANDIKADEIPLAQDLMKKTGLTLDEIVSDDYFKAKLKTFREAKVSQDAVPSGTKRSSATPKDSVDYWMNKPFTDVPQEMRIKVVNKRIEMSKSKNPFGN